MLNNWLMVNEHVVQIYYGIHFSCENEIRHIAIKQMELKEIILSDTQILKG